MCTDWEIQNEKTQSNSNRLNGGFFSDSDWHSQCCGR